MHLGIIGLGRMGANMARRLRRGGIEVTALQRLSDGDWSDLAGEAAGLIELLADREPLVYSRYGNWWKGLRGEEQRTLGD